MEPPYGVIWDCLRGGNVVPFLGAGTSLAGRPASWQAPNDECLPDGKELAAFLAREASFPSTDEYDLRDLAKVSSYYEDVSGRPRLVSQLRKVFDFKFQPGEIHRLLANIDVPQVIVVTNYDTLVEDAFIQAKKPFDLVVYPCDRADFANAVMWWPHGEAEPRFEHANSLPIALPKTTVIFKMHGTIVRGQEGWDNFVVTEDDYVDFLARMDSAVPKILMTHFRTRGFLFLGYSLRDWNLRVVLKNVSQHLLNRANKKNAIPSWAIQKSTSELERLLWGKRNVSIFDMDLQVFVQRLVEEKKRFEEEQQRLQEKRLKEQAG